MFFVDHEAITEIEERKSRFISYLLPVESYQLRLDELREVHKKANHHVWAFRKLNRYEQIEEGCSDDGEPSGTSGPPTLRILQGNDLINTAVITVRYFGGTKLGTGGLVRAYGESVKQVIKSADLKPYLKLSRIEFFLPFKAIPHAEYLCEQTGIRIVNRDFGAQGADVTLEGPEEDLAIVQKELSLR